jgi:hypothetical protein
VFNETLLHTPKISFELPEILPVYTRDFSLLAYTSHKQGKQPLGYINNLVTNWKRSKTFVGGAWQGSFTIKAQHGILEQWFYNHLGYHIKELSFGFTTWEGFVYEMDLVSPGTEGKEIKRWKRRRMSYETLANSIRCDYTDPDTGATGSTAWVKNLNSIARYGQKDEIIQRNLNATNALEAANEYLTLSSDPRPILVSFEKPAEESFLEVTVAGYISTANFRYTTTDDASTSTVGDWIDDIVTTDLSDFMTIAIHVANSRSIVKKLSSPTRALRLLEDLLTLRDGSGNRFNLVFTGPASWYHVWQNNPLGILRGGVLRRVGGADLEQTPRIIEPGIYRDADYTAHAPNLVADNSFFQQPSDFMLETIEVDAEGGVIPRLGVYEDEEALRTFQFKEG